jgi:hypothetical protein
MIVRTLIVRTLIVRTPRAGLLTGGVPKHAREHLCLRGDHHPGKSGLLVRIISLEPFSTLHLLRKPLTPQPLPTNHSPITHQSHHPPSHTHIHTHHTHTNRIIPNRILQIIGHSLIGYN